MPKKDAVDDYMISESGNWNVAARFSEIKIMIPLAKCDVYEDVAKFGYVDLFEELMNYGIPPETLKLSALNRLINELIKIAKNCRFAMKKQGTKTQLEELEKRLYIIKKVFPLIYKTTFNQISKTSQTKLNSFFPEILERVLEIKAEINDPLNKNHLIFTDKEEFDPKAFKDRIKNRMIDQG